MKAQATKTNDITKEESDRAIFKIFKILGINNETLNNDDDKVRNAMVPMIQAFCTLLSLWPGPYQEEITKQIVGHSRYLGDRMRGNKNAKSPAPGNRLPSPREAYGRIVAAGWIMTSDGWLRCRDEYPGDLEFALGKEQPKL